MLVALSCLLFVALPHQHVALTLRAWVSLVAATSFDWFELEWDTDHYFPLLVVTVADTVDLPLDEPGCESSYVRSIHWITPLATEIAALHSNDHFGQITKRHSSIAHFAASSTYPGLAASSAHLMASPGRTVQSSIGTVKHQMTYTADSWVFSHSLKSSLYQVPSAGSVSWFAIIQL